LVAGPGCGSSADSSSGYPVGGGAVVVRGEAGVGKSALLSEAARSRARRLTNPIHAGGTNPITAMQGQTDEAPTKRLTQTALR
jgi:hypothetical protein